MRSLYYTETPLKWQGQITERQRLEEVDSLRKLGSVILTGQKPWQTEELIGVTPDGNATVYDSKFGAMATIDSDGQDISLGHVNTVVTRNLRFVGVRRKQGQALIGRFIPCGVEEVQPGDRAIFVDERGKKYKSVKLDANGPTA
jgi:hypothetical protein